MSRMRACLHWIPLLATLFCTKLLPAANEEKVPPPKPFIFSLGGLSGEQVETLKTVPGVEEVVQADGRTKIVFQPFNDNPWCKAAEGKPKWIKGAEKFYDFLPIRKQIGHTRWTHGGLGAVNAGTVVWYGPILSGSHAYPLVFNMMFDDLVTGKNEVMSLTYYSDSESSQIEHEMLRGLVGQPIRIEKCGKGHAIVAGEGRSSHTVWQVSNQTFVKVSFCFDREMVAAYIDRFGCITPSDYEVSLDRWVQNEIRWRMKQLDCAYEGNMYRGYRRLPFVEFLISYFPEVGQRFGDMSGESSLLEMWQFLYNCRNFLWANRLNFKFQPTAGWYVLKGKDLYDPKQPPELPEDLRGPPKPTEEQIRGAERAVGEREQKDLEVALRGQIKAWNEAYKAWVSTGKYHGRDWGSFSVSFGFPELEERMGKRGAKLGIDEAAKWLEEARGWLWANRDNFEFRNGYYLKGPDRYDPKNPPELPDELRVPASPLP